MLGDASNSRLWTRIREHDGLSYGVGSRVNVSSLDESGTFRGFAICAPQNADKVEAAFLEEVARARKDGFDAKEIADAKAGWLQENKLSRMRDSFLARSLTQNLYLDRTFAWEGDLEKKIEGVTAEQLVAALRKYVDPAKITIVKAGDIAASKAAK
jgi:zinc protease